MVVSAVSVSASALPGYGVKNPAVAVVKVYVPLMWGEAGELHGFPRTVSHFGMGFLDWIEDIGAATIDSMSLCNLPESGLHEQPYWYIQSWLTVPRNTTHRVLALYESTLMHGLHLSPL